MAQIRPFAGIRYAQHDVSAVLAPPYDVLDEAERNKLLASSANNIVKVDLPHLPPKTAGPDQAYADANATFQDWLKTGVLKRDHRRAFYPYQQSYEHGARTSHRRGFIAVVRLSPFGEGHVIPHERTYPGPIEDRLKLMRATMTQLSPIFGLFSDARSEVTNLLFQRLIKSETTGTLNGVRNDLWSVTDAELENSVIDFLGTRPIYIADGHHRYTTALSYQQEVAKEFGGKLPPTHPANYCMFVLVGMQEDGLQILPTHRLIGNLDSFDIESFRAAVAPHFEIAEMPFTADHISDAVRSLGSEGTLGLFDGKTRKLFSLKVANPDVLASLEPSHSEAWRRLDVAILQRYLLDEVLKPKFAAGREPTRGYTADPETVAAEVTGQRYQLAILLRPTPLHALEELGRHGEVMPPKSTYFFPKLATGMVMNPIA